MSDILGSQIDILGLSDDACNELRKCNIKTVKDLLTLINKTLISETEVDQVEDNSRTYSLGLREAILSVLKEHPNIILDCDEIREKIIEKYGDNVSNNIASIRSVALTLSYAGLIERASSGQYFYPSNHDLNSSRTNNSLQTITLTDAVSKIVKTITGEFDYRVVRDKIIKRYGRKISTKKSSIKNTLNRLERSGIIKRTYSGNYVYCSDKSTTGDHLNRLKLDQFLNSNIGKEIEFRYKTRRPNSEKRWRRETLWAYDDNYLYAERQYPSGRHIYYLKKRITEFRKYE